MLSCVTTINSQIGLYSIKECIPYFDILNLQELSPRILHNELEQILSIIYIGKQTILGDFGGSWHTMFQLENLRYLFAYSIRMMLFLF